MNSQKIVDQHQQKQPTQLEQTNNKLQPKSKIRILIQKLNNTINILMSQIERIYTQCQMQFNLNKRWAQKIIMNLVAPVELAVPKNANKEYITELSNVQPNSIYQAKPMSQTMPIIDDASSLKSKYKLMSGSIKNNMSYPLPSGNMKRFGNDSNFDLTYPKMNVMPGTKRNVEQILSAWVQHEVSNGGYVNNHIIQSKAIQISKNMNIQFSASSGWLKKYYQRNYQIYQLVMSLKQAQKQANPQLVSQSDFQINSSSMQNQVLATQISQRPSVRSEKKKPNKSAKQKNGRNRLKFDEPYLTRQKVKQILIKYDEGITNLQVETYLNKLDPERTDKIPSHLVQYIDELTGKRS